jgi:uncharacterized membrane protein YvlD (DUF360 family)
VQYALPLEGIHTTSLHYNIFIQICLVHSALLALLKEPVSGLFYGLFDVVVQFACIFMLAQLCQGLRLDLADTFTGHTKLLAHFF